jgi:hypothetical protein
LFLETRVVGRNAQKVIEAGHRLDSFRRARVVIFLASEPVPIEQVDFIKWENLPLDKH